ncbi:MAG: ATP-binding protein, partial [Bacteroidales bacterium]|nr:ATP-binding protein [Bacteroidales bacterium]
LMQQVISTLHTSAEWKHLVLETRMTDRLMVTGDANIIQTIFRNLLSNAIKFTPESGRITIDGIREKSSIAITVSDTGVGIPAQHLNQLFSMEEQYTMPGTNNEKGTGLGLILCREYMEQLGGTITVTSTVGKGSAFTVTFPAV